MGDSLEVGGAPARPAEGFHSAQGAQMQRRQVVRFLAGTEVTLSSRLVQAGRKKLLVVPEGALGSGTLPRINRRRV